MHNGHRGINHPVKNLTTGKGEITSQNHGFAINKKEAEEHKNIEITHINEISGNSLIASHLLEFDSVHGRWNKDITSNDNEIVIEGKKHFLYINKELS